MKDYCGHRRVLTVSGKVSDQCSITWPSLPATTGDPLPFATADYVPGGLGLGGGDYLNFRVCLSCHEVVGFPDEDAVNAVGAELCAEYQAQFGRRGM